MGCTKKQHTDYVGVFCSPLSNEYELAAKHFSLSSAEVRKLCEGTVESIFTGEDEKNRLRKVYSNWDSWAA